MIRHAASLRVNLNPLRFLSAASAVALLGCAMLGFSVLRAAAQAPSLVPGDAERIVGRWVGQTKEDGVVSVTLTTDGRLGYQFTGGEKDHGYGAYRLQSPDVLLYTAHDETETEHWSYGFDSAGRLRLKMEEDNPKDVEEYTLSRVKP
jgi:hypothetical protein